MDIEDIKTTVKTTLEVIQIIKRVVDIGMAALDAKNKIVTALGKNFDLEEFEKTMFTIEAVLRDADEIERQQKQVSNAKKDMLKRLKHVVYEVDDLFDEVATLAHYKKNVPDNKVSKEIRLFFSHFTRSRSAAKIKAELDGIAKDHRSGLMQPFYGISLRKVPRETHSHVSIKDEIIGRCEDMRIVTDMLLNATVDEHVPVVAIVGIGGMGKTALAQLLYNDERIQKEFPLRMWIWVSDDFDIKVILHKILKSATNGRNQDDLVLEELQKSVRRELDGKKYLLVLDDIWNEDSEKWLSLRKLLDQGVGVCRILVTTRSRRVARMVAVRNIHELQGLAEQDSCNLLSKMAFEHGQPMEESLLQIGQDIVRKYANVPLAIRDVGSTLRGQDARGWESMRKRGLANVDNRSQSTLMDVLKLGYYDLPSDLKCCFYYCAIFPKDYKIIKEDLICLWMAQGFIKPSSKDDPRFEERGDDYFNTLYDKCFFQDVVRDDDGKIISCKMHNLIHDLAAEVAREEIQILSSEHEGKWDGDTHHLFVENSVDEKNNNTFFTTMTRMRTLFLRKKFDSESLDVKKFRVWLSKARFLRALDLQGTRLKKLPDMIDELLHLRYLDLSGNPFEKLPKSLTKLYNLQTLKLRNCSKLKKLSSKVIELVKLRHLDIYGCTDLKRMPSGLDKLTSLQKLTAFVVGGKKQKRWGGILKSRDVGKLGDLNPLINRTDFMVILIKKDVDYKKVHDREGGYLLKNQHLKEITICWLVDNDKKGNDNKNAKEMLRALKPHLNLKKVNIENYPGDSFCAWSDSYFSELRPGPAYVSLNLNICLPNLVKIRLYRCERLKHLPFMSELCHLQILHLIELKELEYVERNTLAGSKRTVEEDLPVYFPSLEQLILRELPKLKGWIDTSSHSRSFPKLCYLDIDRCDNLNCETSFPRCPALKVLPPGKHELCLQKLIKDDQDDVSSCLLHLVIEDTDTKQILTTLEGTSNAFPLGSIKHITCRKTLSGLERRANLTALKTLEIRSRYDLEFDDADMPWRCFAPTLRSLTLEGCNLVKLPKGMSHLTSLHFLQISYCPRFETLPDWIKNFTSLQSLTIKCCRNLCSLPKAMSSLTSLQRLSLEDCSSLLYERYKPHGPDWPNIQHINYISLNNQVFHNSLI